MPLTPGVCRHCGCTEMNACMLQNGEPCGWIDSTRMVCSNPSCQIREAARVKAERRIIFAVQDKRERERRQRRRSRRRGRAA